MKTWGYAGEKISTNSHFYKANVLLFENLFLNSEGSFVRILNKKPVFLDTSKEIKRIEFADISHKSIVEFNKDLTDILGNKIQHLKREEPEIISKPYTQFLEEFFQKDLEMFRGIVFENEYNCNTNLDLLEYFVKLKNIQLEEKKAKMKESIQLRRFKKLIKNPRKYFKDINHKKFLKLIKNPKKFLQDIKL